VARTYAHRHGPGPLPTESAELAADLAEPHNQDGPWQGPFRVGWPDRVLARYARAACQRLDALALTHLDFAPRLRRLPVCSSYDRRGVVEWRAPPPDDLPRREEAARRLAGVQPDYEEVDRADLADMMSETYDAPLVLTSTGPTAHHVKLTGRPPW